MEELLKKTKYDFPVLRKGQKVEAVLTAISSREARFDIGAKTEGTVRGRDRKFVDDLLSEMKIGDKVLAYVAIPETDNGQILLSLRKTCTDFKWKRIQRAQKNGEIIEVRGVDTNKGGLVVEFAGLRGFIPGSQLAAGNLTRLKNMVNRYLSVKIIEAQREKNRLIFSEKAIAEVGKIRERKKIAQKIKIGGIYGAEVMGIVKYGLFVKVEADTRGFNKDRSGLTRKGEAAGQTIEGLVHISEVSWEKVGNLEEMFKVGDKIKVKVLGIDERTGKLNLSIKHLTADPWGKVFKKYKKDKVVKGTVSRKTGFGYLVELEKGVEGLLHISKVPVGVEIKVEEKVSCVVEETEPSKRRILLTLVPKGKPLGYK